MYVITFSVEVKVPVSAVFKSIGYCFIAHPSCSSFQTCHRCYEIHPHTLKIGGINTQPGQCPEHKQVTQNHLKTTKKKKKHHRDSDLQSVVVHKVEEWTQFPWQLRYVDGREAQAVCTLTWSSQIVFLKSSLGCLSATAQDVVVGRIGRLVANDLAWSTLVQNRRSASLAQWYRVTKFGRHWNKHRHRRALLSFFHRENL